MTIFTTHNCRFVTLRRLLVAKEYMETQLILFEGYRCQITACGESSAGKRIHLFQHSRLISYPEIYQI